MTTDDKPAFEVHEGERVLKIWADGRVEGFDSSGKLVILNRIPMLLRNARAEEWR